MNPNSPQWGRVLIKAPTTSMEHASNAAFHAHRARHASNVAFACLGICLLALLVRAFL